MNAKNFARLLSCFAVLVFASVAAQAGVISSGGTFTDNASSGIGNVGRNGPGVNFNGSTVVVNGVTFAGESTTGGNPSGTLANGIGYALSGVPNQFGTYNVSSVTGTVANLANSFYYGGPSESFTLSGLTPGVTYLFAQYNFSFGDATNQQGGRIQNITDSQGAGPLTYDENSTGGVGGNILLDKFLATGTTFSVDYVTAPGNNGNSFHQYDFQLTTLTPEPSSFILAGLGVVGLLFAARRRRKAVASLCVLMALALGSATSAQATPITIGLGPNASATNTDNSGTRINVDLASAVTLQPGTYTATSFDFTVAGTGNAQPFLAVVASGTPGSNAIYDPIAVGNNVDITSFTSLTTSSTAFGGSNTFTLLTPTTVYAGVSNISGGPNPVGFIDHSDSIKRDDHSNPAQSLTVGTDLTTFTNYGLPREYAFSITTTPEPSSFILGGLAAVGLFFAVRRRRKA